MAFLCLSGKKGNYTRSGEKKVGQLDSWQLDKFENLKIWKLVNLIILSSLL
jgi:hypothetical protein